MAYISLPRLLLNLSFAVVLAFATARGASAVAYNRPKPRADLSITVDFDADGATPQQVHISMVGANKVRLTWITDGEAPAIVDYGTEEGKYSESSTGSTHVYSFATYTSGKIHEAVIGPLDPDTAYFYRCGGNPGRELSFKTPPAGLPIKFTIVGNLTSSLPSVFFNFVATLSTYWLSGIGFGQKTNNCRNWYCAENQFCCSAA